MRCHAPILVVLILVLLLAGASPLVAVADDEWTLEDGIGMQAVALHQRDLTSEGAPAEVEGRPLHEWILLLGKDAAQRVEAERVLAGLGPAALPALVAGLGGRPFGWSEPSARLLARLLPTEPESLRRWLGDRRPARRAAAAWALGCTGDSAHVPALLEAIDDDNTHVRAEAWFALARIGGDALESAVPRLAARLDGTDATNAFIALARAGGAGRDLLFRKLPDPELRKRVAALWWFRGEVVVAEGLAGLLDASSRPVRAWVAKTLGQLAPLPPTVTPALVTALADESTEVVWYATWAVRDAPPAVDAAVESLRRERLSALLAGADRGLAAAAAIALVRTGSRDEAVIPPLLRALETWQPTQPGLAADYARLYGVRPGLSSTQGPRQDAEDALVVLGAGVVPHVARLMQGPSAPAAVAVLGRLGEPAWPALTAALEDPRSDVRRGAAFALLEGGVADPRAFPLAVAYPENRSLTNEDLDRVTAALTAPGPAAVEHLAALLEADAGYGVPRVVTRALVALGPSSAPVLPRLLRLESLDWGGDLEDGSRHYPAPTAETFVGQIVVAIGASAVPYLCEAVASVGEEPTDAALSAKAFRLLRLLGPVAKSALPMLREEAAAGRIDLDEDDLAPFKAE